MLDKKYEVMNSETGEIIYAELIPETQVLIDLEYRDMIADQMADIIDANYDLTEDEKDELLDYICVNYGDNTDYLIHEILTGDLMITLERYAEDIIENRKQVYTVPVTVTYYFEVPVLAKDKYEAREYVRNMETGDFTEMDMTDLWDIFDTNNLEIGSAEENNYISPDECINYDEY